MSIEERRRAVRNHGYCTNCLARSHTTPQCTSAEACRRCGREHHTLLHLNPVQNTRRTSQQSQSREPRRNTPQQQQARQHQTNQRLGRQRDRSHSNNRSRGELINRRINQILDTPSPNPKRIIRGIVRALERLEKGL